MIRLVLAVVAVLRALLAGQPDQPPAGDLVLAQAVVTAVVAHGRRCGQVLDLPVARVRLAGGATLACCFLCLPVITPGEADTYHPGVIINDYGLAHRAPVR